KEAIQSFIPLLSIINNREFQRLTLLSKNLTIPIYRSEINDELVVPPFDQLSFVSSLRKEDESIVEIIPSLTNNLENFNFYAFISCYKNLITSVINYKGMSKRCDDIAQATNTLEITGVII